MIVNEFEIRSYGWQELAVLYGPDLMPESAGKRLSKWVGADPVLETELQGYGWRKGKKTLTPRRQSCSFWVSLETRDFCVRNKGL